MKGHGVGVDGEHSVRVDAGLEHLLFERTAVVRGAGPVGVARERDGEAFFDQGGGSLTDGGRDEIDCAELVVGTPAAPVRQLFHPSVKGGFCDGLLSFEGEDAKEHHNQAFHGCDYIYMLFSNLELARRLEGAEGYSCAQFAEARRRISPGSGAAVLECGGAYAVFDGVG